MRHETADTSTLQLVPADDGLLAARPGQFVMVEQPGFPPFPISVSRVADGALWLTIRAAGPATAAVIAATPGTQLGLRGPLGRGWPIERAVGRDVVIVAGGIGLAPLRPLIDARDPRPRSVRPRPPRLRRTHARGPAVRRRDRRAGRPRGSSTAETVDRAGPDWLGPRRRRDPAPRPARLATADRRPPSSCGPERMMEATVGALRAGGIQPERTFVSLERHMECGIGLCGHCQMGPFFICRDGPVFSVSELGDLFGREGI